MDSGPEVSGVGCGDHFDGAGVFGAGLTMSEVARTRPWRWARFLQGDGAGAGNLAADVAVDAGGGGGDGVEEFDAGAFFDPQVAAVDGADDLAVAADDEIAGAFDRAGEFAEHGEVVAADGDAADRAGLLDGRRCRGFGCGGSRARRSRSRAG